jgi:hypothetical protein
LTDTSAGGSELTNYAHIDEGRKVYKGKADWSFLPSVSSMFDFGYVSHPLVLNSSGGGEQRGELPRR